MTFRRKPALGLPSARGLGIGAPPTPVYISIAGLTLRRGRSSMHGVAPHMCGRVSLPIVRPRSRGSLPRLLQLQRVSPPRLIEASQFRRRLILPGRHQGAVGPDEIALAADLHIVVDLAQVLEPERLAIAAVTARDRPW